MRFILLIWLILWTSPAFSRKTLIKGEAPSYAGKTIVFYEYEERILSNTKKVFEIIPDKDGIFRTETDISEIKYLFTTLESCIYYFYAIPGKTHHIEIPAPLLKTPEQKANPYFSHIPVHINVNVSGTISNENCEGLNEAIRKFDHAFDPFYHEHILRYYSPLQSREKADSFLLASISQEPVCCHEFYEEYTHFRKGILEFSEYQYNRDKLIETYFAGKRASLCNPAWWDLFNTVFEKYFSVIAGEEQFNDLYRYIAASDYISLDNILKNASALENDTLRGLIIIKEIHSEFFQGFFSQQVLSALLDSVAVNSNSVLCRNLAGTVKKYNTQLLKGSTAPEFSVIEAGGGKYSSTDMLGKYVYIGFCNPHFPQCIKEFEYLRYLHNKHNKYLVIITVFDNISGTDLKTIKEENNYPWLITSNTMKGEVFSDFNVRAVPQFFLIAPDGTLALTNCPLPSEGFERILFSVMRSRGDI